MATPPDPITPEDTAMLARGSGLQVDTASLITLVHPYIKPIGQEV
jgi:hypothetical protein